MPAQKPKVTVHSVGSKLNGVANAGHALAVITEALAYLKTREEEQTKRAYIAARRDVLVSAVEAKERVLTAYFEQRFAERKGALDQFYALLHRATESGDQAQLDAALAGILGIVKDNPLKDLETFAEAWKDPNFNIEF